MILPQLSVIIPCYNIEKHIEKCIDSVLCQTFENFELLLLDDGSTDQTLDILKKCEKKDPRIKVFTHANRGVSYTRNRGIELAAADYIMFIDGDDWIEDNMVNLLIEPQSPTDIMRVCGMVNERNGEVIKNSVLAAIIKKKKLEFDQNQLMTLFPSSILSSPCCKLYNKKILLKNNIIFDESISYQEDLKFNLEYLQNIKLIKIIPEFKYHYVEHETSSSSRFHKNLNESIHIISKLLIAFPNYEKSQKSVQIFNIDQILKLISNYLHKNSTYTLKEKYNGINQILTSNLFRDSEEVIMKMNLGKALKVLLKSKNVLGIIVYFQLNKIFNSISK